MDFFALTDTLSGKVALPMLICERKAGAQTPAISLLHCSRFVASRLGKWPAVGYGDWRSAASGREVSLILDSEHEENSHGEVSRGARAHARGISAGMYLCCTTGGADRHLARITRDPKEEPRTEIARVSQLREFARRCCSRQTSNTPMNALHDRKRH